MGYAAVALLAATGAINTLLLVGNVNSLAKLAATPYGADPSSFLFDTVP